MRGVIIFGSSRRDGHTGQVIDLIRGSIDIDLIDLSAYEIGAFDYEFKNQQDDFMPLMKKLVSTYDFILFATPVYWYSMSGILKNFVDRISDCLKIEKEVGRELRGKTMGMISCGYDEKTVSGFAQPFSATANYLGMEYFGDLHTWIKDGKEMPSEVKASIIDFAKKIDQFLSA